MAKQRESNPRRDLEIYKALKELAERNQTFTSADLLAQLRYETESPEARKLHATIMNRKKDGIIETVSKGRKRHQTLQVNPSKVQNLERYVEKARRGIAKEAEATGTKGGAGPSAPKRVVFLEERVEALERVAEEQKGFEKLFSTVQAELAELRGEVRQLVEMWS